MNLKRKDFEDIVSVTVQRAVSLAQSGLFTFAREFEGGRQRIRATPTGVNAAALANEHPWLDKEGCKYWLRIPGKG